MFGRVLHRLAVALWYAPPTVLPFLFGRAGREYGLGFNRKLRLMRLVYRNATQVSGQTSFLDHLSMVSAILSVPRSTQGVVAEFGCYKGRSTASLSLACRAAGRRLVVFDSFEGLPEPQEQVTGIHGGGAVPYHKGQLEGTLEEVRHNVRAFGDISVCEFVKGYFEDSLPQRNGDERYCMVFEDADLPSSVRTVIRYAWPKLQWDCVFFTHEARDLEVMKIFFDDCFWNEAVGCSAPGIIGSGLGLTFSPQGSHIAYVVKSRRS